MIWLLISIVILGYIIAIHKEIIMYFRLLWEKYKIDINPIISYLKKRKEKKKKEERESRNNL